MKKFKQLGLIGCGMMGGSFALAAKRAGIVQRVVGYNKSPNKAETAKRMGIIDDAAASILQAVMGSDLVVIAVPVAATYDVFKAVQFGLHKDALILDVGSTKQSVIQSAKDVLGTLPHGFVPSHPIAGKEIAGIEAADANLYSGKRVLLTPTENTHVDAVRLATEVWHSIGMTVSTMPAEEHDRICAAISHLPHLLAFAFINGLSEQADAEKYFQMAGSGFRDFTRIAGSDAAVWTDILLGNRDEILKQSELLRQSLAQFESVMKDESALKLGDLIRRASHARSNWAAQQNIPVDDV